MALPVTLSFGNFVVTIDDGTGSNQVAPCGFMKKSLKITKQSSDTIVPDCDNPDALAWLERNEVSISMEISGSGVLAQENVPLWQAWMLAGGDRTCKVTLNGTGANGGGVFSGSFILTDWTLDVDRKSEGGRVQQSLTLQSDGQITFTANP